MGHSASKHLGIDAVNIRQGGGLTHLVKLLEAASPEDFGFAQVTVWCGQQTARALPPASWMTVVSQPWMDAGLPRRVWGHQWRLGRLISQSGCDVVFSPGGTLPKFVRRPQVTMSQNLLPFEPQEAARFGKCHPMRWKMWLLRQAQARSFKRADGIIFLTQYAQQVVERRLGPLSAATALVPHGVEPRFRSAPRPQRQLANCSIESPFKLLYVSILMPYKHQLAVMHAVAALRRSGAPVELTLVGQAWGRYGRRVLRLSRDLDPSGTFIRWRGAVAFDEIAATYHQADAFIFASSCENLPNIMIEAMAAGLPIISSSMGPMPEVLGRRDALFDPTDVDDVTRQLRRLLNDATWRGELAATAWERAAAYSWQLCAKQTMDFLAHVLHAKGGA
jgi:glycosyltransferase involved in cell wall biosynthesis